MPFLAGICTFGSRCENTHPPPETVESLLASFSQKPCQFGRHCETESCLFMHPQVDESRTVVYDTFYPNVLPQALTSAITDPPASGVPQHSVTAAPFVPSASWSSAAEFVPSGVVTNSAAMPQWQTGSAQTEGTIDQNWPIDSGVSFGTGYVVGIDPAMVDGKSIGTGESQGMWPLPGPPPGEKESPLETWANVATTLESTTAPWASVAAAASELPVTELDTVAAPPTARWQPKKVKVPQSIWTHDLQRDPAAFQIEDPIARYEAVNQETHSYVMDLHFQSTRTAPVVLDELLESALAAHQSRGHVWVVTGTGHHTGKSHVKAGALFEAVKAYLIECGYDFDLGADKGGYLGAFCVRCWPS